MGIFPGVDFEAFVTKDDELVCSTCAYSSILKGPTENPREHYSKAKEAVSYQSERQVFEGLTALALIREPSKLKRVRHVRA
uniref:Reverse transcriptase/retrotransposon-derived protein RNase H-like domain-containing protein n=1 Tax=Trichuris muris TaxID=70415 RepID=A0A5S6QNW0_TRIMR